MVQGATRGGATIAICEGAGSTLWGIGALRRTTGKKGPQRLDLYHLFSPRPRGLNEDP
jgi:hypothetical protein